MTREEALFYAGACDDFNPSDSDDAYSGDELHIKYPGLSKSNACDWAIYGFTVQDWLTVESQMTGIASYVEQLRSQISFLVNLIGERQKSNGSAAQINKKYRYSTSKKISYVSPLVSLQKSHAAFCCAILR